MTSGGATPVSPRDVALLRLAAQRLVGEPAATPSDAVRWLTAVQAQDERAATLAVALRTRARDRAEVARAFAEGQVVRSWPMRGTLHTVAAEDLPWMLDLMTARPRAAAAKRRPQLGLSEDDVRTAHRRAEVALAGTSLTRASLLADWDDAGLATAGGRGYHLVVELAQRGVLCLGPVVDGEHHIVLLDAWVPEPRRLGRDEALGEIALRFFRSHGPATVADLARWTGLAMADVRAGVAASREQLEAVTVDGTEHLMDPATPERLRAAGDAAAGVLLLPAFDEVVLGYRDRSATLAAAHEPRVVPGGNGVFRPVALADGRAVGTWRYVGSGKARRPEFEPFEPEHAELTEAVLGAVAALP